MNRLADGQEGLPKLRIQGATISLITATITSPASHHFDEFVAAYDLIQGHNFSDVKPCHPAASALLDVPSRSVFRLNACSHL